MNRRIVVSTPGKLILMGEHAAVYGQPALVAAVDPRSRVEARIAGRGLRVELADLGVEFDTTWAAVRQQAERSRSAWRRYVSEPTPERFAEIGGGSASDLTLAALGEVAGKVDSGELRSLAIRVESGLPIGSGFGSSASIAVALIGGLLTLFRGAADPAEVDSLAFEVERRQHGLPSGVDHKAVLYGGVVVAMRDEGDALRVRRLATRSAVLNRLQVRHSGRPTETTGEVVAAVRQLHDSDRPSFNPLLDRMGKDVLELRDLLELPDPQDGRTAALIRDYQACLEELGVVPDEVQQVVRSIEAVGGSAKISGAGALTGPAAGCLLVYWPDEEPGEVPGRLAEYPRQDVVLGVDGFRVEEVE